MSAQLIKKIRTTNQIVFSLTLIAFCYLFIFYFLGFKKEGLAVIIVLISMAAPLLFNYFQLFFLARIWFLAAINIAVFIYSYLFGADAGIQLAYFSFVSIPWILFEFHEWKYILSGILMPIAGYYVFNYSTGFPLVTITPEVQHSIYLCMVIVVFVILTMTIMFFVYNQNLSEKYLLQANNSLMASEEGLKIRNEKLTEIAWIQSHKLRRPVATILGLIQLLDYRNPVNPENKKILDHINTAGKELDGIIGEINDMTQITDEE